VFEKLRTEAKKNHQFFLLRALHNKKFIFEVKKIDKKEQSFSIWMFVKLTPEIDEILQGINVENKSCGSFWVQQEQ
jgi:hypothetical protein